MANIWSNLCQQLLCKNSYEGSKHNWLYFSKVYLQMDTFMNTGTMELHIYSFGNRIVDFHFCYTSTKSVKISFQALLQAIVRSRRSVLNKRTNDPVDQFKHLLHSLLACNLLRTRIITIYLKEFLSFKRFELHLTNKFINSMFSLKLILLYQVQKIFVLN